MDGGWIQLHRKIIDSPVAQDPFLLKLWILCLVRANYMKREVLIGKQTIIVERGQFVTGRDSLAKEYNNQMKASIQVKPITLWRWMQSLETMGNLHINSNNKFSLVTVVNYDFYNAYTETNDQQNDQLMISKRSADDQQMITDNKDNKDNKINKETKKNRYAEFVRLTETEHSKLVDRFGESLTQAYITKLDNYKGSTGKRYKSDYRTIMTWIDRDMDKQPMGGIDHGTNRGSSSQISGQTNVDSLEDFIERKFKQDTGTRIDSL